MAVFFNQATLTYNGGVANSNIVSGEIVGVITATKTATPSTYGPDGTVTYVVTLFNSGTTAVTDLTVSDDLGAYTLDTLTLVPLDYVEGSVRYFADGVLQPAPTVGSTSPLTITGISVPAGGSSAPWSSPICKREGRDRYGRPRRPSAFCFAVFPPTPR